MRSKEALYYPRVRSKQRPHKIRVYQEISGAKTERKVQR